MAILVKLRKTLSQNFVLFIFCGITGWYLGGLLDDHQNHLDLTEKYEQVGPMTYKERNPAVLKPNYAAQKAKDLQFQEKLGLLAESLGPQLAGGGAAPVNKLSFDQEPMQRQAEWDNDDEHGMISDTVEVPNQLPNGQFPGINSDMMRGMGDNSAQIQRTPLQNVWDSPDQADNPLLKQDQSNNPLFMSSDQIKQKLEDKENGFDSYELDTSNMSSKDKKKMQRQADKNKMWKSIDEPTESPPPIGISRDDLNKPWAEMSSLERLQVMTERGKARKRNLGEETFLGDGVRHGHKHGGSGQMKRAEAMNDIIFGEHQRKLAARAAELGVSVDEMLGNKPTAPSLSMNHGSYREESCFFSFRGQNGVQGRNMDN